MALNIFDEKLTSWPKVLTLAVLSNLNVQCVCVGTFQKTNVLICYQVESDQSIAWCTSVGCARLESNTLDHIEEPEKILCVRIGREASDGHQLGDQLTNE